MYTGRVLHAVYTDSIGRRVCNNVTDMVARNNRLYCIGHYKRLLQHCRVCGHPRSCPKDALGYDGWYYCNAHKPPKSEQEECIHNVLSSVLCNDVIDLIVNLT